MTPGACLRDAPPGEKLYIPSSASAEMTEWALPARTRTLYREASRRERDAGGIGRFLSGGHFRQFLTRYPEAGLMYAKMMYIHVLVNQVRGDRYKKRAAQNELWKGQCHYAYWHGARGGVYSNPARKAVYRSLIEAEKITRATEIFAPSILSADYDMDNCTEYLYQGSELNAYIHTRGGSLFELDFLPASTNYLDTMAQRDGEGTAGLYSRKAFLDHFLPAARALASSPTPGHPAHTFGGRDFVHGLYQVVELNRSLPEVLLRRNGQAATGRRQQPAARAHRQALRVPAPVDRRVLRVSRAGRARRRRICAARALRRGDERLPRRPLPRERAPVHPGRGQEEGDRAAEGGRSTACRACCPRRDERSLRHPVFRDALPILEHSPRDV